MNKFEKISEDQWLKDTAADADFAVAQKAILEAIKLPTRGTAKSAGYDFYAPTDITLAPGKTLKIATGIKAQIDENAFLGLFPKSGLAFKYRLQLDNTVGIVDSDYYNNKGNEGHIFIKITNDAINVDNLSTEDFIAKKTLTVKAGSSFAQGIFIPFLLTVDDAAEAERVGGLGSTSK